MPIAQRLGELFSKVTDLLKQHPPDLVAIEESFVGRHARCALAVGQARGAIVPTFIQQAVRGYGRADKARVQEMAKALLGLQTTPTPTHAADALAVAICHALAPPLLRLAS